MPITYHVENFEGPLDLLLQLIEEEELDITQVSLGRVADQFVKHVERAKGKILPEEMADFLVVAAKLVYMKSKLLIPSLQDAEMEEGPDLASQLKLYQQFVRLSKVVDAKWKEGRVSFPRERRPVRSLEAKFSPPSGISMDSLRESMLRVIERLAPIAKLPEAAIKRIVTIQEKIADFAERLRKTAKLSFSNMMSKVKDRNEAVISFLALLELVKQRVVSVSQGDLFKDIEIVAEDLERLSDLKVEFV